jgi:hypothetical protein
MEIQYRIFNVVRSSAMVVYDSDSCAGQEQRLGFYFPGPAGVDNNEQGFVIRFQDCLLRGYENIFVLREIRN